MGLFRVSIGILILTAFAFEALAQSDVVDDQRYALGAFVAQPVLVDEALNCAAGLHSLGLESSSLQSSVSKTFSDSYTVMTRLSVAIQKLGGKIGDNQVFVAPNVLEGAKVDAAVGVFKMKEHPDGFSSRCGEYSANLASRVGLVSLKASASLYKDEVEPVMSGERFGDIGTALKFTQGTADTIAESSVGEIIDCLLLSQLLERTDEFKDVGMVAMWAAALNAKIEAKQADPSALIPASNVLSGMVPSDELSNLGTGCLRIVLTAVGENSEALSGLSSGAAK